MFKMQLISSYTLCAFGRYRAPKETWWWGGWGGVYIYIYIYNIRAFVFALIYKSITLPWETLCSQNYYILGMDIFQKYCIRMFGLIKNKYLTIRLFNWCLMKRCYFHDSRFLNKLLGIIHNHVLQQSYVISNVFFCFVFWKRVWNKKHRSMFIVFMFHMLMLRKKQ